MFWNAQEQEERDYHPQSELQNLGMMNRKPDDTAKIQKAIQEGKHVVIEAQTEFCPYTDAILGNRQLLVSIHDTRDEAQQALDKLHPPDQDNPDPDINAFIRPYPPVTTQQPYNRDEIPF